VAKIEKDCRVIEE